MLFKEFGNRKNPVIILFHGGGLSWWSLKPQVEMLQKDYFVVTPIIDGHGEDFENTFKSIEDSAQKALKYIKTNCGGKVFAICGLSIGAQITVEILSRESEICEYAVIESALVVPIKAVVKFTVPMYNLCYGLIKKRWFAKIQAKSLFVPEEYFEQYFRESSRMTKKTLINIAESNGNYSLPKTLKDTKAKALIIVGEKELKVMKKSAEIIGSTINGSILKVIEKSGHGEISLMNTDTYLGMLRRFLADETV